MYLLRLPCNRILPASNSLRSTLADSIFSPDTEERFKGLNPRGDIPDLIVLIARDTTPTLIAIEGKMYMGLTRKQLDQQLIDQNQQILSPLKEMWPTLNIVHAAIVPELLLQEIGGLGETLCLTWENVLERFREVSSAKYFLEVLATAIAEFSRLRAHPRIFDANADGRLCGQDIADGFGHEEFSFRIMGRDRGISGQRLLEDVNTGSWRTKEYQVSKADKPPNGNWFEISEFVKLIQDQ